LDNTENHKRENAQDHIMHPDERAGASGPWLEAKLKEEGLVVHVESGISHALAKLNQLRELVLSKGSTGKRPLKDLYTFFSESYGVDFLTKALHWGHDSGLRLTNNQWKLITKANPNIATKGESSTERNKVWEIIIGSIAKTFCDHVSFEEPDILCTYGKYKISVAAKMAYSEENIFENVRKGLKQAKGAGRTNEVDSYLIFVNIVNIYPFFDVFKKTMGPQTAANGLNKLLIDEVTAWCDKLPLLKEAKRLREETNKPVGVGFFIPFTLVVAGNPMPFFYVHMPLTWTVESEEYKFAQKFLQACGVVLGYPHNGQTSQPK
jgi:hypothetical protein